MGTWQTDSVSHPMGESCFTGMCHNWHVQGDDFSLRLVLWASHCL